MSNYIAVGVNKLDKVWKGHFGISPVYKIYNREGEFIEERENPQGAGNGHNHDHDHGDDQPIVIKELLNDCTTFVGKRMGEESKLKLAEKLGIETVLTENTEPQEVVKEILNK